MKLIFTFNKEVTNPNKLKSCKIIKEMLGMGLKEAKDIIDDVFNHKECVVDCDIIPSDNDIYELSEYGVLVYNNNRDENINIFLSEIVIKTHNEVYYIIEGSYELKGGKGINHVISASIKEGSVFDNTTKNFTDIFNKHLYIFNVKSIETDLK